MRLYTRALVVAGVVLAGASGCASTGQRIDGNRVAREITRELGKAYAPARVTGVDCPSKPELQVASRFRCDMQVGEAAAPVEVTVKDTAGNVSFTPVKPVVVVDQVEDDLAAQLHDVYDEPGDAVDVTVRCAGPRVRIDRVGATFRCTVVVDGSRMSEEVTVADRAGNVTYRSLQ